MDGTGSIRCVNCGKPIVGEAKFFADVLVCDECNIIATRIYERGTQLLKRMAILFRDTIKWTLAKGKLSFPKGDVERVDDNELLQKIVGLHLDKDSNGGPGPSEPVSRVQS